MKLSLKNAFLTGTLLVSSLLSASTSHAQTPGVIGIKFGFTGGYATSINLEPLDQAGVLAVTNWNNLLANVLDPKGNAERAAAINITWPISQDSAGNALSGVTLTPRGFNDGWYSGGTGCANARLLYNCWKFDDASPLTDVVGKHFIDFTIANLPSRTYDVYVYVNNNNGNYWGNIGANSVIAVGSDLDTAGFNGASADPCGLATPLHTAAGYGNPANYVKLPSVVVNSGGTITVTAVLHGGSFGLSGVQLVPKDESVPLLTQDTLPNYAETVVGDQVVFTAAFADAPAANLQWQFVTTSFTNDIPGATSPTLTLANVQLSDSGSYQLKATSQADSTKVAYSTPTPLLVNPAPAPVNNVVVNSAVQTAAVPSFYPFWSTSTSDNLVYGFGGAEGPGTAGTWAAGPGTYDLDFANGDPGILSDGVAGNIKSTLVTCGWINHSANPGQSITYTLITDSAPNGFELTNIMVFGGWTDAGRNSQTYEVLYSTMAAPTTFVPLTTVNYWPNDPSGAATATRVSLTPGSGVLAHNVCAVQFNFNTPVEPKNGYEGYSEIVIKGTPSQGVSPVLVRDISVLKAEDVVGGALTLTADFTGATGVQWQKNGNDIPGAKSVTLTLANLQVADTGSYRLVGSNAGGTTLSRECVLTVNPVPAAVGNVVTAYASQSASYPTFTPTWSTAGLNSSLIHQLVPSSFGNGHFTGTNVSENAGDKEVLTDGIIGTNDFILSKADLNFTCIGSFADVGNFVVYTFVGSATGYTITNITTFGGWNDGGRDMQAYTVSYATASDPATFIPLSSASYNPVGTVGYSFTRTRITPATGVLAANVVALKFDFTTPAGENGWSGYSEISVYGSPSPLITTAPTVAQPTISGTNLIVAGVNGTPNSSYAILTTTNVAEPLANWTVVAAGVTDSTGAISNAIPVSASQSGQYFRVRMP